MRRRRCASAAKLPRPSRLIQPSAPPPPSVGAFAALEPVGAVPEAVAVVAMAVPSSVISRAGMGARNLMTHFSLRAPDERGAKRAPNEQLTPGSSDINGRHLVVPAGGSVARNSELVPVAGASAGDSKVMVDDVLFVIRMPIGSLTFSTSVLLNAVAVAVGAAVGGTGAGVGAGAGGGGAGVPGGSVSGGGGGAAAGRRRRC